MSAADRRRVTHGGAVVPHLRWPGWWRWRCRCGSWCRTDNRDVAELTLARHLEICGGLL